MAAVTFDDPELALMYVSEGMYGLNHAYLCVETGQIFYSSERYGDAEDLPVDIDDVEKYVRIPHENDLNLGRNLVFRFVDGCMPKHSYRVREIFHRRGAYVRYKDFLDTPGMLDSWHSFEDTETAAALNIRCEEQDISIDETAGDAATEEPCAGGGTVRSIHNHEHSGLEHRTLKFRTCAEFAIA